MRKEFIIALALGCQILPLSVRAENSDAEKFQSTSVVSHPVYKRLVKRNPDQLKKSAAPIMNMTDETLRRLLPRRSGIFYVICPTPGCGNPQGTAFDWNPEKPAVLTCLHCRKVFPSAECPEKYTDKVVAPSGKELAYTYYLAPNGRKHYFSAGIEFRKAQYFSVKAYDLAKLYYLTGDEAYARKASVILCGIARNYPDFVYKFDFPYRPVEWYNGTPEKLRPHFRTSRWSWWGFLDVPEELILAYDLIANSRSLPQYARSQNINLKKVVIDDFFLEACKGTLRNPQKPFQNMTPLLWTSLAIAGKVTGSQALLNEVQKGIESCLTEDFFFDGFWQEPT